MLDINTNESETSKDWDEAKKIMVINGGNCGSLWSGQSVLWGR